ncbi:MAG TPA: hypothetical protein VJV78_40525 [Polyangiales bacterium]|nr:hypothetical protein [Polyangiales bacterium]
MTMRLSGIALAGLIAALGVSAAGCGGDDGETKSPTKKEKEDKPTAGQVGCGPKVCKPAEGFMGQLCCKSAFDGTCGQMVAGTCTDLPPEPDKRCESTSFTVMGNAVQVPSCCTGTDECGLVFNAGFGAAMCTSLTQASRFGAQFRAGMNMMFMFTGDLPAPKTCSTGKPIEVPTMAAGSGG